MWLPATARWLWFVVDGELYDLRVSEFNEEFGDSLTPDRVEAFAAGLRSNQVRSATSLLPSRSSY